MAVELAQKEGDLSKTIPILCAIRTDIQRGIVLRNAFVGTVQESFYQMAIKGQKITADNYKRRAVHHP